MLFSHKQRVNLTFFVFIYYSFTLKEKDKLKEDSVSGSMSPSSDRAQK